MIISAKEVAKLREITDCGMMECKKALTETGGDIEKAVEFLRSKGIAKAAKVSGRIAAEGIIVIKTNCAASEAVMLEINCETDFVARDSGFLDFVNKVAETALKTKSGTLEALGHAKLDNGVVVDSARKDLIAKIGENITLRRVIYFSSQHVIGSYVHGNKIGVLVLMEGGDTELQRDIAMHIVASKPVVIGAADVSQELIAKEEYIYSEQAKESGKPQDIVAKMVQGRIKKFVNEISLEGQLFVKDPNITVKELLVSKGARVVEFVRFELGEGIEKRKVDFAAEVMEQLKGS